MKIAAILASLAIATTGAAAQVEETAFNLGHYIKHNVIGISEEEAFKLGHFIAHNVVGISEEEDMSLAEMAKRYNKVKKFIPVAEEEAINWKKLWANGPLEEEDLKLPKIGITIGEEEDMSLIEMAKRYNKIKKFIPVAEEENMSLIEMAKRYNKVKKFIPVAEEEAINWKKLWANGPLEEEDLKLPKIGITIGEEEDMSLIEMAKRYNKVKKFIPVAEEENLKIPKIGITIGEEENLKLPKIGITIGEEEAVKLMKFLKEKVVGLSEEEAEFSIKHYIAHNVIGITEEEEAFKLPPIHVTIGEEENMSLIEMAKRYNKVKKFIPVAEEEQNFNLKEYLKKKVSTVSQKASNIKNYLKNKISGPTEEEEQDFNLKNYIKHNVIGISEEEQNMSLKEMAKRYNKVKKFIPAAEEEAINWKKLWANGPLEEEDLKLPKIGITIGEEEDMSLIEMAKRYNKVKKFIPVAEEENLRIVKTIPIRQH